MVNGWRNSDQYKFRLFTLTHLGAEATERLFTRLPRVDNSNLLGEPRCRLSRLIPASRNFAAAPSLGWRLREVVERQRRPT